MTLVNMNYTVSAINHEYLGEFVIEAASPEAAVEEYNERWYKGMCECNNSELTFKVQLPDNTVKRFGEVNE